MQAEGLIKAHATVWRIYRVGQKSDTARTLHYIVREVSLFWPTLYLPPSAQSADGHIEMA